MYAITFDIDTNFLKEKFPSGNAYGDVRKFLESRGFKWTQGSVYFGDPEQINAVSCVMVVQELAKTYPWFSSCVKDIRMLRIEENNDLMPAVR